MPRKLTALGAFVFFALVTVALTYPLAWQLADHLRDVGDSFEYAWVLGFGAYQLLHDPLHLYQGNIFYPFPLSLAYSDSTVPNILLGAPVIWLTNNPILAHNLLVLLTFLLAAFGMYLLVAERTGNLGAALVAGLLFGFSPYHFDHLAQLPNVSVEWAPLALWSFERYARDGRYRWAALFALFTVAQVLASFYDAFILGLGLALYVTFRLVQRGRASLRPRWLLPWVGCCAVGAVAAAPFILPYFTVERTFGLQRTLGEATAYSAWPGSFLVPTPTMRLVLIAPLLRYLTRVNPGLVAGAGERYLYPGVTIGLLALLGLVASIRGVVGPTSSAPPPVGGQGGEDDPESGIGRLSAGSAGQPGAASPPSPLHLDDGEGGNRDPAPAMRGRDLPRPSSTLERGRGGEAARARATPGQQGPRRNVGGEGARRLPADSTGRLRVLAPLLMVILGIGLSFGPTLHLTPDTTLSLPFSLPYAWLFAVLPGFAALRVPPRFSWLLLLGLALLAGDGLALVAGWLGARTGRWRWRGVALGPAAWLVGCAALALAEGWNAFPLSPVPVGASVPPVYRWLATQPHPSPVLELPIDANAYHESPRAYLSTYDHQPLVDGSRSFFPPGYRQLLGLLNTFPSDEAIATLQRLRVRDVVVHESQVPPTDALTRPRAAAAAPLVARFGSDVIYALTGAPPPGALDLTVGRPGCLAPGQTGNALTLALQPPGGAPVLALPPATRDLGFRLDWRGAAGTAAAQTVAAPVPAAVLPAPVQVRVPYRAPVTPGPYTLTISLTGATGWSGQTTLTDVTVGGATPAPEALPRLVQATLPSPRPSASGGVPYVLVWQVGTAPAHPLVVFVNAYDAHDQYWSYPSGEETQFAGPPACPTAQTVESGPLPLLPDAPVGQYWVEAGLRDTVTGQRVPFQNPEGQTVTRVVIGSFWLAPPGVYPPGELAPTEQPAQDFAGLICLTGWEVTGAVHPGGALAVGLRWTAERPVPVNYTAFVHLIDPHTGRVLAQFDGQPTKGRYPASAWLPGETIVDRVDVPLPATLPPGPYQLTAGLYDLATLRRLPLRDSAGHPAGDQAILARFP